MQDLLRVPTEEVERHFARYREQALTHPVVVTTGGEPRVVMISSEEFERLRRRDRRAIRVENLPDELVTAIAAATPPEDAARFDDEVR